MSDLRHVSPVLRRRGLAPAPLALAILLGACGAEAPNGGGPVTPDTSASARTGVSPSATQLADDQTTTLRDAIAFASDDEITVVTGTGNATDPAPQTGAATPVVQPGTTFVNPLAVLPEPDPATAPDAMTGSGAVSVPTSVATSEPEPTPTPATSPAASPAPTDTADAETEPTVAAAAPSGADTGETSAPGTADPQEPVQEPVSEPTSEPDPEPEPTPEPESARDSTSEPDRDTVTGEASASDTSAGPDETPAPDTGPSEEEALATDTGSESDAGSGPDTATDTSTSGNGATIAPSESASATGDDGEYPRVFTSRRTEGFVGELRDDGSVRISWKGDPSHRGYNVYRQSEYLLSVGSPELIEEDLFDGDYYYEIQAYHYDDDLPQEYVAKGLTVQVRDTGRTDPDAPVPNQDLLDGYDLVFADEFDTGALDGTKWNSAFLWGPDLTINSEVQYYVDILREPDFGFDPFTFEDGNLVINSVRTPDHLLEKAGGREYLSGILTSYDAFQFTYGYSEMRARMPYGTGYWPAFWLLNAKYDGPNPEIDIMEFIGDNEDTVYHTYHYYDSDGVLRSTHSEPTKGVDYTADFHTFGADWRPGLIVFYVDGVEVHRVSDPEVSRQDMYVLVNTAMGGWWAGPPDETTPLPGRFEIDYIRVYRQTAPYEEPPQSDAPSRVAPASQVPGASPGHRPPFEQWPEGYPGRF